MSFVTEYPSWLILICIGFSLACAFFLYYYRDKTFTEHPRLRKLLFVLRTLLFFFITLLLINPVIKHASRRIEKPLIIIAQDASESVLLSRDSSFYRGEFINGLKQLSKNLSDNYQTIELSFSSRIENKLNNSFDGSQTNISALISYVKEKYANKNIGALVLASDGLYNQGANPYYDAVQIRAPIYTVALGDTALNRDVYISKVLHNKTAFLGNNIPVEVVLRAAKSTGSKVQVVVTEEQTEIFRKEIDISSNNFSRTISFQIPAKQKGLRSYIVSCSHLNGELTLKNNRRAFFVDVHEKKLQVLVLSEGPHPDIGFLKRVLEKNQNYELKIHSEGETLAPLESYSLIVLHQVPGVKNKHAGLLEKIKNSPVPLLFILGAQSSIKNFNALQMLAEIDNPVNKINSSEAVVDDKFSLFTVKDITLKQLEKFPPLTSPFGRIQTLVAGSALAWQKVNNISTDEPLIFLTTEEARKMGMIFGEGFWKWGLYDYKEYTSTEHASEVLLKIIQYLSSTEKRERFNVRIKNSFFESEQVIFEAELFNESNELINESDVKLQIKNQSGKIFSFLLGRTDRSYYLEAGYFPPGRYQYTAQTEFDAKNYFRKGEFIILPNQMESSETSADHELLFKIATSSGGEMVNPKELKKLESQIRVNDKIKPMVFYETGFEDFIKIKWLLLLIVLLASVEWVLRKTFGII